MIECCFYCNALFPLFCIWWGKERRCNQKLLCLCRLISGLLLLLLLLSLILLFCNFFRRLVVKGDNYPKLCFLFSKIYSRWRFLHRVNKLNFNFWWLLWLLTSFTYFAMLQFWRFLVATLATNFPYQFPLFADWRFWRFWRFFCGYFGY